MKSSLSCPAHKYLRLAPQARVASCRPFPTGPAWKNCRAQLRAQKELPASSPASGVYTPLSSSQGPCTCSIIPATGAKSMNTTHGPWHRKSSPYHVLSIMFRALHAQVQKFAKPPDPFRSVCEVKTLLQYVHKITKALFAFFTLILS